MIKVPATPAGIPADRRTDREGVNINVTLMFSMRHYEAVARAYINGLERCGNPSAWPPWRLFSSAASTRSLTKPWRQSGNPEAKALAGKIAIANSKLVYRRFLEIFHGEGFAALRQRGARVQRPLWASTGTKNPAYSDVLYVEHLIGPETVNTMPPETMHRVPRSRESSGRDCQARLGRSRKIIGATGELRHRSGCHYGKASERWRRRIYGVLRPIHGRSGKKTPRDGRCRVRPAGASPRHISETD